MAISFADKKRRIFAEARKPEAKTQLKKLAKALKNISKFPASERGELKKLVESIYENLVEKPKKGMQGGTKKSSTPTTKLSQILKEFKAKIGNEKWREATRGTTIEKDMERPALKKGKRIVRRNGKTTNQYGTFKNKVGGVYYESRANRSDINQPSKKLYPKLADGGEFGGNNKSYEQLFTEIVDSLEDNYNVDREKAFRYVFKTTRWDETKNYLAQGKSPNQIAKTYYYELKDEESWGDVDEFNGGGQFAKGGKTGKKQIKRKKVTRQYPNYDKEADSGLVAKPQGYRFTEKLAKKLGVRSYAKPTQEQIEKYRGRGVYSENRQDKSDVKPKRTYPSLGDGGEFGGGGKTKSIIERIKKANTISEKDINLLKRRYNANSDDESVKEVLDYYNEVDFPKLDADQTKKGYDFLMNLWKSPTGKVRANNPFGSREQRILDDFSHFEFGGFYDDGNSYRSNFIPIYIVHSKDGAAFEYIFRGGSLKIIGKDGGQFAKGGRTGKKQIKRKKVTRQYPNYDKESDSGLVGKPQGHRFTDKLAKKLGVKSYAKPTKEQIEKYRGRGVYSENRQDKSDVNPKRTYPSL